MDGATIAMFALQTVITVLIGAVGWGIKNTLAELKNDNQKNREAIKKVEQDLSDLKSDLPIVYVLREDFIRSLNNVDTQMGKIDGKLDRLLIAGGKG